VDLRTFIRDIPDFPEKGIIFRDITPLLKDKEAFKHAIDMLAEKLSEIDFDLIVAPEARGFIFGCPVATTLEIGFVPVRKPNKLPRETISYSYDLEYGSNTLCLHKGDIKKGQRVLIVDDLLATGGTIEAAIHLIEESGGIVAGTAFLVELTDLKGRDKLKGHEILTLMRF